MPVENKIIKYTIDLEAAKSKAEISELKKQIKELRKAYEASDKRLTESKAIKDKLATTEAKLALATEKATISARANTTAHKNSTFAINKEIQRLTALNQTLDINGAEYAKNQVRINELANTMNRSAGASGAATSSVLELGRVVSDAPYGIRGMANNLTQLTQQMFYAAQAAGGFGAALRGIWSAMLGPLGIIFAITTVISLLDFFASGTNKASKETKDLDKELKKIQGTITSNTVELEAYAESYKEATEGTNEHTNALKELKDLGYDPTTESLDAFIEKQKELIVLEATSGVFKRQLEELAEEKVALDKAVEEANRKLIASQDTAGRLSGSSEETLFTGDKFDLTAGARIEESANRAVVSAIENVNEKVAERGEIMASINVAANKYKDLLQEILALTSPSSSSGGGRSRDTRNGRIYEESLLNLEKLNQKYRDRESLAVIRHEEDKLKFLQEKEVRELGIVRDGFIEKENLRHKNYLAQQKRRIENANGDKSVIDDANALILAAEKTHNDSLIQAEEEYQDTLRTLRETHLTETFVFNTNRERANVEHQQFMRDILIEQEAWVEAHGRLMRTDTYERELAALEEDAAILNARLESFKEGTEERLALEKEYAEKSLEITSFKNEREMSMEQAKADFRDALLNATATGFGALSRLAKKNSEEQKTFALLEIAAGTAKGLINGLDIAQKQSQLGNPWGFPVFYATQVGAVLSAAARAKAVLKGGSDNGGGSGTPQGGSGSSFNPNFDVVGNSNVNQLAEGISNQTNQPVQAYVVYEDIQTAGETVNQSEDNASI